jgi:hypothetical protein
MALEVVNVKAVSGSANGILMDAGNDRRSTFLPNIIAIR